MKITPRFRGINQLTLDSKGRVAIPAKYRKELEMCCAGRLVITADRDEYLLIYPRPEWEKVEEFLIALPAYDKQARFIQRLLLGYATECEMNSQGRVPLSPPLRSFARIDKQAVLMGQGHKFELWSAELWPQRLNSWIKEESNTQEVSDTLATLQL